MSDDFRIPAPASGLGFDGGRAPISSGYRTRRAHRGLELPWLKLAAGGAGALLLVAVGGWAYTHRHPATIPVIEADQRPLRVKPDNPGGLQVAGADELEEAAGGERMAPTAEAPAPQALRAQIAPPPAPPAPAAPPLAAPPLAAPLAVGASPLPDTPPTPPGKPGRGARPLAPSPATAAPPSAAPPSAAPPSAAPQPATANAPAPPTPAPARAGAMLVQLGALASEAAAQAEWQRLARTSPDLVAGRQPTIQKTEHDGKTLWRLRTGGFADVAEATGFCTRLRAKGAACTIASF